MTHFLALIAGLAGGVAGFIVGLVIGGVTASWLGISGPEDGAGHFSTLVGLAVGTAGLLFGVMHVLHKRRRHRRFGSLLGHTVVILLAMGGLATAGVFVRLATLDHFDGPHPQLFFEIRLPSHAPLPEREAVRVELHTDRNSADAILSDPWRRRDGDRIVIAGRVPLHLKTSKRTLVLSLPDAPNRLFTIDLGRTPRVAPQFGDWRHVDFVEDKREAAGPRKPGRQDDFDIRIRVPDWVPAPVSAAPLVPCDTSGRICS